MTEPRLRKKPKPEAYEPSRVDQDVEILRALPGVLEVFSTPSGELCTTIDVQGQHRTILLGSSEFASWLVAEFYAARGRAPSSETVIRARALFETRARFGPSQHEVFVRFGHDEHQDLWLDLGDSTGRAVQITSERWMIIDQPGVRFRRPDGLLPLPEPVRGGSVEDLRPFINVGSQEQFVLAVGWLITALQPCGPFPVLIIEGEQGSAKSLTSRLLRRLIDPNRAELRSEPTDRRDLAIAASNALVVAFDNISSLRVKMSDALCCLSTGGGFSTRRLYTDNEEVLFEALRPCLLNGINYVATRGDLSDRAISLKLPVIKKYKEERSLLAEFELAHPQILGALLDAVSAALRHLDKVELKERLRMVDAAVWVTAAEEVLPWEVGAFVEAYKAKADENVDQVLDSELITSPLMSLAAKGPWDGTSSELLEELFSSASQRATSSKYWPGTARALSNRLKRLAPDLRKRGIDIEWTRTGDRRVINIRSIESPNTSVISVTDHGSEDATDESEYPVDDSNDANDGEIEESDGGWLEDESISF